MNNPRVYTRSGRVAHLLRWSDSPNARTSALCGQWPGIAQGWRGTGSQTEYEKATALPLCKQCAQKANITPVRDPVQPQPILRRKLREAQISGHNRATVVALLRHIAFIEKENATLHEVVLRQNAAITRTRQRCLDVKDGRSMINAHQIVNLLSLTWPDGNYSS